MIKKYAIAMVLGLSLLGGTITPKEISKPFVLDTRIVQDKKIHHINKNFFIEQDGDFGESRFTEVENAFIDKELRNLNSLQLDLLLGSKKLVRTRHFTAIFERDLSNSVPDIIDTENVTPIEMTEQEQDDALRQLNSPDSYLELKELSDGQYAIKLHHRLVGGGFWGAAAGAWVGKWVTSFVLHGSIGVASAVISVFATPVAGTAFFLATESTLGATIESISTTAAFVVGLAGGVATGPV